MACKGKQKSMAHNEGCGDHRRKYRKRKIGNGRQRKATNWCGKKRPFTENCQPPAPSNGGERKKKRGADVSRKATDDGGQKNNGKFTNGKSEKKNYGKNFTENNPSGHLYWTRTEVLSCLDVTAMDLRSGIAHAICAHACSESV